MDQNNAWIPPRILIKIICAAAQYLGFFKACHVTVLCIARFEKPPPPPRHMWPHPPATSWTFTQTAAPLLPPLQPHWPPHWSPCSSSHSSVMLLLPQGFYFCYPICLGCSFQDIHMTPSPTFMSSLCKCQFISKAFPDHPHPLPWCQHPLFFCSHDCFSCYIFVYVFIYAYLPNPTVSPVRAALCLVHYVSAQNSAWHRGWAQQV